MVFFLLLLPDAVVEARLFYIDNKRPNTKLVVWCKFLLEILEVGGLEIQKLDIFLMYWSLHRITADVNISGVSSQRSIIPLEYHLYALFPMSCFLWSVSYDLFPMICSLWSVPFLSTLILLIYSKNFLQVTYLTIQLDPSLSPYLLPFLQYISPLLSLAASRLTHQIFQSKNNSSNHHQASTLHQSSTLGRSYR